jgi:hypothetical protein
VGKWWQFVRMAVVCVIVTALLAVASAHAARADTLGNGFKVAHGSRLVGTTFPILDYQRVGGHATTAALPGAGPGMCVNDPDEGRAQDCRAQGQYLVRGASRKND